MNENIFYFFYNFAHQSTTLDRTIVFFAETFPTLVLILAGLFVLFHHDVFKGDNSVAILKQKYKEMLMIFFAGALAWVLAHILKFYFEIMRPAAVLENVYPLFEKSGYAFPSGHAAFFGALALTIYFAHKKAGYFFAIFALAIGVARVMAGVHFPIDILGGLILGFVVSFVVERYKSRFAYYMQKM